MNRRNNWGINKRGKNKGGRNRGDQNMGGPNMGGLSRGFNRGGPNRGYPNRGGPYRGGPNRRCQNRGPHYWGSFNQCAGRGWKQYYKFKSADKGPQNVYGGGSKNQWHNKKLKNLKSTRTLSEKEIGITAYISEHKGFNGIIKSRFSDFHVSEVNLNGQVAKLTSKRTPQPPAQERVVEDEDLLLTKYNLEILPMETWDQINSLDVGVTEETVEINVTDVSKEQRKKIHESVRKAFGKGIVGNTVNEDGMKFIKFEKFRTGVCIDQRVKWVWPAEYVHFIVYKENCDTMDAAVRIAERLKVSLRPTTLGYSGTKDRRAKTSQWFSLRKVDPRDIANKCRDLANIHVGNYSFSQTHLRLGMLQGNVFRIALRNVRVSDEIVNEACDSLSKRGFINYFGHQRFGSVMKKPTYEIGLKLLQGNIRHAIEGILEDRGGRLGPALGAFRVGGAAAALPLLPRHASAAHAEMRLIRALAQRPHDLAYAIHQVPRNTLLLYLHAYQSLLWNNAVSERVRRFGLEPVVGDLVPLAAVTPEELYDEESDNEDNEDKADNETRNEEKMKEAEVKGDPEEQTNGLENFVKDENAETSAVNKETNEDKKDESNKIKNKPRLKVPVKVLTQEDIDSGIYSIFDIVMPLPGYDIDYPPNMKDFYEEMLKKDNLKLDLRLKSRAYKDFDMPGTYRHVVALPKDLSWRCVRYRDPCADLLRSDLDEMEDRAHDGIVTDGKFKAVLLTMTLPSSCYATMALRELLKVDTSLNFQASQNDYHNEGDSSEESNSTEDEYEDYNDDMDVNNDGLEAYMKSSGVEEVNSDSVSAEKRKYEDIEEYEGTKKLKQEE